MRLLDDLDPANRPRAIAFVAAFPDFWSQLQKSTQTALQETVRNADAKSEIDYRILAGVKLLQFRDALATLIEGFSRKQLVEAIAFQPLSDLWPKAIKEYQDSGGWRTSEENFKTLISPYAGRLDREQLGQVCEAVTANGQNWGAAETDTLLLALFRNAMRSDLPTIEARNRFFQCLHSLHQTKKYADVLTYLQSDGWSLPAPDPAKDD